MKNTLRKNRISAWMAALAMLAAGCSEPAGTSSQPPDPPAGDPAAAAEAVGAASIHVLATTNILTQDLEALPMYGELEKKLGVSIEWEQVRNGWDEKKSVILASSDLPDVFLGGAVNAQDIAQFTQQFAPIDAYLEDLPNLRAMFEEIPLTKKLSTFEDGHMYAPVSVVALRPQSICSLMINQAWLDKLGLEVPSTFGELETVLIAFRDQDPNGNGIQDEIPFDFQNGRGGAFNGLNLIGGYGIAESGFGEYVYIEDGKVEFLPAAPAYKELIRFFHRLYAENLLNKEVMTQDYSQFQAKAWNPEVPLVGFTAGWSPANRIGPAWNSQYTVIPPLRADGYEGDLKWVYSYDRLQITENNFVMTSANQHIEETIRLLNELYSEEMAVQQYFGSFGDCVEKTSDGKYKVLPPEDPSMDSEAWAWTHSLVNNAPMFSSSAVDAKIIPPDDLLERLELDKIYDPYRAKPDEVFPMVVYSKADSDELSILWTDLFKYTEQKWAEWITKGSIEEEWDGYISQLESMGLPRMLDIMQAAFDASRAS